MSDYFLVDVGMLMVWIGICGIAIYLLFWICRVLYREGKTERTFKKSEGDKLK